MINVFAISLGGGVGRERWRGKTTEETESRHVGRAGLGVLKEEEKWKSLWSAGRDGIKSPLFFYHPVSVKVCDKAHTALPLDTHTRTHTCSLHFCSKQHSSLVYFMKHTRPGLTGLKWFIHGRKKEMSAAESICTVSMFYVHPWNISFLFYLFIFFWKIMNSRLLWHLPVSVSVQNLSTSFTAESWQQAEALI